MSLTLYDKIDNHDKTLDSIPLEVWFYIFEYISDCDVAALNGLNRYYRQLFNCRLLYKQRFHKQFINLEYNIIKINTQNNTINSRKDYFDYWRIFHEFKVQTGLNTGTHVKLDCIYDELFELTPNLNNKWRVIFISGPPDEWECRYEEETVFDSYLMHETDSEGRCKYCKPYPSKVSKELPLIVPRVWFDPKYQEFEKLNYIARQQFRRYRNNPQVLNRRRRARVHQRMVFQEILERRINRGNYI